MPCPSYERVDINNLEQLDEKIKLLRLGVRPIVFDISAFTLEVEAEEASERLTQFISGEGVSPLYPNPIYLISSFPLENHPFQQFDSYEKVPALYKKADQLASLPVEKKLQQKLDLLTTKIINATNENKIQELNHIGHELGELNKIGKICSYYENLLGRLSKLKRFES